MTDGTITDKAGNDVSDRFDIVPRLTAPQARKLDAIDGLSTHQTDNGGFVFAFFRQSRMIEERFPSLLKPDLARLMYVGSYIAWESGQLRYDNGVPIDKDGLHALVDMSRKRFNEFYARLLAEDIVQETADGAIHVNPSVFYRGGIKTYQYALDDVQYTRMFRKTVRELYAAYSGRSLGQLALVYEIMPFVNFQTNIVAYNADESQEALVRPMSLDKLALLLGYGSAQKLKTALNRVKVNGKPVFGFFENPHDRRKYRIVVNPRVIYAGDGEGLRALEALFS
ncbi:hypothetical protein [Sporosarcina sp. SAFN-015]|uniref:hypothetical protein n=1 Tax=Sporosarcina sp. SAFN-015 TaxID=3387274 RepID=UPI003F81BB02